MEGKTGRGERAHTPRRDHPPRNPRPKQHDTYARRAKSAEAFVCDRCGVVNHGGRWYWGAPPLTDEHGGLCPACERILDRYPAGTIRIPAELLREHEGIHALIRNVEELEKAEHPLERLMDVEETPEGELVVTTTGIHLARAITGRLERVFHRDSRIRYPEEQHLLYVDW